ncbi:hypothetical protein TNCV_1118971 [Trichonephila clavipes]|uniref:Uncharacterized protein n=1 Tax=Trichonephila clavipes TaxID=2585209 RepID=A0A8X6VS73_TRICX|nr:hypothetical protein TNCV_1118971 [Trichonephila clavipes]
MWRRRRGHSLDDDVFREFLRAITTLYPPMEEDVPSLVEEEERWEATEYLQGVLPQNREETVLNHSVTCMVLKATANDRSFAMMKCVGLDLADQSQHSMSSSWALF